MLHALLGNGSQALLDAMAEGDAEAHIKSATDESEPQGFARQFGQPDANTTEDAFARFEYDTPRLFILFKGAPSGFKPAGVGAVKLRVRLQGAIARGTAIAMQTPRGFRSALATGQAGTSIARTTPSARTDRVHEAL